MGAVASSIDHGGGDEDFVDMPKGPEGLFVTPVHQI